MKPTIADHGVNFNHKPRFAGMRDIFDSGIALRYAFQNHSPLRELLDNPLFARN